MFKNQFELTGRLMFPELKTTESGKTVFVGVLSKGSQEKGYENFKIKAFKDTAQELMFVGEKAVITAKGWLSQKDWKDRNEVTHHEVYLIVNDWEEYQQEE